MKKGASGTRRSDFGDELGALLLSLVLDRDVEWAGLEACDIVAPGCALSSISNALHEVKRERPIHVWGAGVEDSQRATLHPLLHPLTLRGGYTKKAFGITKHLPMGDPLILTSMFFDPHPKYFKWGIVAPLMLRSADIVQEICQANDCLLIDPLAPPLEAIAAITSCHAIISPDMSGLIVADSFNIPCYWLTSDAANKSRLPFLDYCSGVDRPIFPRVGPQNLGLLTSANNNMTSLSIREITKRGVFNSLCESYQ